MEKIIGENAFEPKRKKPSSVPRKLVQSNPGLKQILRKVLSLRTCHLSEQMKVLLGLYSEIR